MRRIKVVLALILGLAIGCSSGGGADGGLTGGGDASAAGQLFYRSPEVVTQAVLKALDAYSFSILGRSDMEGGLIGIKVRKNPHNYFEEDVSRIIIERLGDQSCRVHIMIDKGFVSRWPGEPDWAPAFFSAVYDYLP